jgi:hypothetical protein
MLVMMFIINIVLDSNVIVGLIEMSKMMLDCHATDV